VATASRKKGGTPLLAWGGEKKIASFSSLKKRGEKESAQPVYCRDEIGSSMTTPPVRGEFFPSMDTRGGA